MGEVEALRDQIRLLRTELADAKCVALAWEQRAAELEAPVLTQSSGSPFVSSQIQCDTSDIDFQFYRRMYTVGLRQHVKGSTSIPKVLEISAAFFTAMGYHLPDVSTCIPSASTCSVYCHSLAKFMANIHVAIELFVGKFKNKFLCMFRDGSSFKGCKIETFGVVAYFHKNQYCDYT
eukprot:554_1